MLLSALSYHLLFLLKEHVILALASFITKNILKICSPVNTLHLEGNETQDNQLIHCHNIPTEFLPYTDFYSTILFIIQNSNNKNPLCSTVLHIQEQTKIYICCIQLINCVATPPDDAIATTCCNKTTRGESQKER
jgi:hypothetical protein